MVTTAATVETPSRRAPQPPAEILHLGERTALERLRRALETYRRIALASALGPQSLVLIDLACRHALPLRVLTVDTGLLFSQTTELRRRLEQRYGIEIEVVRPELTLDEQAQQHGAALWQRQPDHCCSLRKVAPMATALRDLDAWITGLRRDQTTSRSTLELEQWDARFGLVKISPLWDWRREDVDAYLKIHDVPQHPLWRQGYRSVGCVPCTSRTPSGADERAGRWAGLDKIECGLHLAPASSLRAGGGDHV